MEIKKKSFHMKKAHQEKKKGQKPSSAFHLAPSPTYTTPLPFHAHISFPPHLTMIPPLQIDKPQASIPSPDRQKTGKRTRRLRRRRALFN
jgi:hypothetical protein